ncbi:hypothetical protein N473_11755 [Pseudoalteromonas luteoviolacea CPMOR-1]|uniref:CopL family metal-binding regulatory protein n=1 Tax=Pseudoalteromonas luteoviolacea CPMOR-1 TaxID=1365248 RepID=A0A167M2E7_9GAMM|nr:hypothetical protein [Pseudoalteromonas luteoviolacea]KZN65695.1 hypothetical protein N473_11755 [Pseudoalteromonas luteoviolacea CPMOR-1]
MKLKHVRYSSTSKKASSTLQFLLVVTVFLMSVFQPLAQAQMICDHDMPMSKGAMSAHSTSYDVVAEYHQHSDMHHTMPANNEMDCCETECACPTSLCAPFSLFISESSVFTTFKQLTEKPVSANTGSPNQYINTVYKPPILA